MGIVGGRKLNFLLNHDSRVIVFLLPLSLTLSSLITSPHHHSVSYADSISPLFSLFFVSLSLSPHRTIGLHQANDDRRHVWVTLPGNIKHQNWEREETIDWHAFEERIRNVISGPASGRGGEPGAKHFLILDGHIILNHKWVTQMPFPFFFFFPAAFAAVANVSSLRHQSS